MPRYTLFAMLTALALTGAGAVAFPAHAESLAEAGDAWRVWTLAYRPDLAVREGARWPSRVQPLDEAALVRARAALDDVRAAVARAPRDHGSPAERALLDSLEARVARETALFARDAWHQDPALYAAITLEAALEAATRGAKVPACERSRRAIAPLRAVPEALRAAQVNLRGARDFDVATVLARWDEAVRRARTELPATFLACKEGRRLADAVEADTLALAAAERFRRFLRDELVQSARTR